MQLRKIPLAIKLGVLAALAVAALLLVGFLTKTEQTAAVNQVPCPTIVPVATATPDGGPTYTPTLTHTPCLIKLTSTPTITPTPTPTPGGPAMSLRVDPSQQSVCGSPTPGKICVQEGQRFDVIVVADAIPALGYVYAGAWIDYDNQGLVHKNNTVALWPDCDSRAFLADEDVANNGAQAGCLTDIDSLPPSFHVGDLFSFSLTCTGSQSSSDIQLLPEGAPPANTFGALYTEPPNNKVSPALTGITVSCVPQSTPTPGLPPAMSLRVDDTVSCGSPSPGKVCVGLDSRFDVIVVADAIPADGYVLAQAWIDYDNQGLVHKNNTVNLWPDCDSKAFLAIDDVANNGAAAGCFTEFFSLPPSFHVGDLYSFSLTCTASPSSNDIQLLPDGDPVAGTSGALFIEFGTNAHIIPALTGITVSCEQQSGTPPPTSTNTSTPTNTPTPPTLPPGAPAMSLRVEASQTFECGSPSPQEVCIEQGAKFDVIVVADAIPVSGYIIAQAWIDYDNQGLVHKNNTVNLWPECFLSLFLTLNQVADNGAAAACITTVIPPYPLSFYVGDLYSFSLTCTNFGSTSTIQLLPDGAQPAAGAGALYIDANSQHVVPVLTGITVNCAQDVDTDSDGCSDIRENRSDETVGGLRDWQNPHDFYDVLGPGAALPLDQVIDLPNDILGVIQHFAPTGAAPYDAQFDRGPSSGPNAWNMTAPDGVIDLPNDILGVILQFQHNCV